MIQQTTSASPLPIMTASASAPPHPLAPLTEAEFAVARDAILSSHGPSEPLFFRSLHRQEPTKAELVPFLELEHAGKLTDETPRPPRLAVVEYDVIRKEISDYSLAIIDLATATVVSKTVLPRIAPSESYMTVGEFIQFQDHCVADPMFQDAITEFVLPEGFEVMIDPWPYGSPDPGTAPPRLMQGLVFAHDTSKKNADANHYSYPIPIIPVMDWKTKKLIRIDRLPTGGKGDPMEPAPRGDKPKVLFEQSQSADYVPELLTIPQRTDLKPLNVVQPEGASFTIQSDGLINWQKWRFRMVSTPREGAVLYDICYDNRPIAYRLSFSEMTVPYGDARNPFHRKQAFDFGDGGMGRAANSLELGCDCLGAIHYVDSLLVEPDGSLNRLKSTVCLHEQDNGILWKHTNFRTDRAAVARNREFVVQFVSTLANYEYVFAYKFDLAGGISIETRATGIVSVVGIDYGKTSEYGNVVSPGVLAQNHQHIFAVRLDPAIDSYSSETTQVIVEENRPHQMNPETNPYGNFYDIVREPVEKATWIDLEPRVNRSIKIENSQKKNAISGKNVAYKFVNPPTQMLLADPESRVSRRAPFAQHNIWVTGYRDGELWAAGEFTNQSQYETGGVGDMVKRGDWFGEKPADGASADGQKSSPVVWGVFGLTHNPRVEDWPVMPVEIHQLHLRPADFFTANPALDVPVTRNESSVLVACCNGKNGTA